METKMTVTAVRTAAKETVAERFVGAMSEFGAVQIEDFEYAVPFETEFGTQYIRVAMAAADTKGTKIREGFTVEGAIAKWEARKAESAEKQAALVAKRAEAKAAKEAAKSKGAE